MMSERPAIDYTNKDYASLRQAMLELASYRLPEWSDHAPGDLGVTLVDLFAYMGDVVLYYQDRIANELFLSTAAERRSVLHHLRLIGYELKSPAAASADLTLVFKTPPAGGERVTIRRGAQFSTAGDPVVTFEYLGPDLELNLAAAPVVAQGDKRIFAPLPVRQSKAAAEGRFSSTGGPGQRFKLAQKPVLVDQIELEVNEGAGFRAWTRRENLLYFTDADGKVTLSGPGSRDFMVEIDHEGAAWVVFGGAGYGLAPPPGASNIKVAYRAGGGAAGNVAAHTLTEIAPATKTALPLLESCFNPRPAAGGEEAEAVDHAVRFGPLAFRSGARAVTLSDFVSIAHQVGGVAKVRAQSRGWNQVDLVVAPSGDSCRPVPEDLKRRLKAFFDDKRMVGTAIRIVDPVCVPIEVAVAILVEHNFSPDSVRAAAEGAVRKLFAFDNVDFGRPLYLSKVYEAVEAVEGVQAATVTRFRRGDERRERREVRELDGPERVREMFLGAGTTGRIEIGELELPSLLPPSVEVVERLA